MSAEDLEYTRRNKNNQTVNQSQVQNEGRALVAERIR
jgi:hypothetical protein